VVDRPNGTAGGLGLGFNGGQLLALAIGGCFCNDLRYAAAELNVELAAIDVQVSLSLEGSPLVATAAVMKVSCEALSEETAAAVLERAKAVCTVANSVRAGFPVDIWHVTKTASV
jgi:organic hydroperoxide reductase OsmC/OhrA